MRQDICTVAFVGPKQLQRAVHLYAKCRFSGYRLDMSMWIPANYNKYYWLLFDLVWFVCYFRNTMHHHSFICSSSTRSPPEIPVLGQLFMSVFSPILPCWDPTQHAVRTAYRATKPSSARTVLCLLAAFWIMMGSEIFNTRAIKTRVREMWEPTMGKENQQTWRIEDRDLALSGCYDGDTIQGREVWTTAN